MISERAAALGLAASTTWAPRQFLHAGSTVALASRSCAGDGQSLVKSSDREDNPIGPLSDTSRGMTRHVPLLPRAEPTSARAEDRRSGVLKETHANPLVVKSIATSHYRSAFSVCPPNHHLAAPLKCPRLFFDPASSHTSRPRAGLRWHSRVACPIRTEPRFGARIQSRLPYGRMGFQKRASPLNGFGPAHHFPFRSQLLSVSFISPTPATSTNDLRTPASSVQHAAIARPRRGGYSFRRIHGLSSTRTRPGFARGSSELFQMSSCAARGPSRANPRGPANPSAPCPPDGHSGYRVTPRIETRSFPLSPGAMVIKFPVFKPRVVAESEHGVRRWVSRQVPPVALCRVVHDHQEFGFGGKVEEQPSRLAGRGGPGDERRRGLLVGRLYLEQRTGGARLPPPGGTAVALARLESTQVLPHIGHR